MLCFSTALYAHCALPNMEGMSNACEYAGIRNALFNTPDDHAQVAVWGVYGTDYVIAQWAFWGAFGDTQFRPF